MIKWFQFHVISFIQKVYHSPPFVRVTMTIAGNNIAISIKIASLASTRRSPISLNLLRADKHLPCLPVFSTDTVGLLPQTGSLHFWNNVRHSLTAGIYKWDPTWESPVLKLAQLDVALGFLVCLCFQESLISCLKQKWTLSLCVYNKG